MTTGKRATTAFTGDGARLYGGRWNPKGVPLVYTASTQSLAALEILVQDGELQANYVMIPADIPDDLVECLDPASLPENWRESAAKPALQQIGKDWFTKASKPVLAVPSAVIPRELNYLLNPTHPDFDKIQIGDPEAFETDFRLLRK